jgi:hypothetical protein
MAADSVVTLAASAIMRSTSEAAAAAVAEWFRRRGREKAAKELCRIDASAQHDADASKAEEHWRERVREALAGAPESAADELRAIVEGLGEPRTAPGDSFDFRDARFLGTVKAVEQHIHYGGTGHLPDPESWPTVVAVDPADLGVHRSRRSEEEDEHPPYVSTDIDADLCHLLRGGRSCRMALVTGEPLVGKTRTAHEAVRAALRPETRLYAPSPGTDLRTLPAVLRGHTGPCVLWLDELEGHLGENGLDPQLLSQLGTLQVPVIGTMRNAVYDRLRYGDGPVRRLLRLVTDVQLPHRWSESMSSRFAVHCVHEGDPRFADASRRRGQLTVPEFLAVGPELWDEWRRARRQPWPRRLGYQLVRTAIDLTRAGVTCAIREEDLYSANLDYEDAPTAEEGDDVDIDGAMVWATAPRLGVCGPLVRGEEEDTWRVSGALLAAALRSDLAPLPDHIWSGAVSIARYNDPDGLPDILRAAMTALRPLAEGGDVLAAMRLGDFAGMANDSAEAGHWYRRAVELDARLAAFVWDYFVQHRQYGEAVKYLEMAAEQGSRQAMDTLVSLLQERVDHWKARLPKGTDPSPVPGPDTVNE